MPVTESAETAPLWAQIAVGLAGFGSFLGMIAAALRPKRDERPAANHVIMEAASLADTRPFKDRLDTLIGVCERNARANEAILEEMRAYLKQQADLQKEQRHERQMQDFIADALQRAEDERKRRRDAKE